MPLIRKGDAKPAVSAQGESDQVLSVLATGNDEQRWAAARVAGEAPGGVQALGHALITETNSRVREAIFTSLVRTHGAEAVAVILPHLRSDDAHLRTGALDALRAMADSATSQLPALLSDPDPDVRLLACEILRGLPSDDATTLLCEMLEREDQVNVCAAAIEVLTEIGGSEALPVLSACAARFANEPFLIFSIKTASARISSQLLERRG